jgi:hypothetical protein
MAEWKSKSNYVLWVHSFIWSGGLTIALALLGYSGLLWKFIMLLCVYIIVDAWKCRGYYKQFNLSDMKSLYIDQSIHVLQIVICIFIP